MTEDEGREARKREIAESMVKVDGEYRSADGIYSFRAGYESYISLDCALTGLPDTTQGRVGKYPLYLQHPGEEVPQRLVEGAREFYGAVCYYQRKERQRREREAAEMEERKAVEDEARAVEWARQTGAPAEIRSYATGCNDPREECSTDLMTVYATPEGTIETMRIHTW